MTDLTAVLLTRQNLRQKLIAQYPGIEEDEQALLDTLEGLDDFNEQLAAALRTALEREAYAKALASMIADMTSRKRRLDDGATAIRNAVLHAMQEAGVKKLPAPDMTVSVGMGKAKIVITDPDAIPDEFCSIIREPSRTAIAKAIAEGRDVPGMTLGNPQPFLTIHRG